jgi:hypothetical protein
MTRSVTASCRLASAAVLATLAGTPALAQQVVTDDTVRPMDIAMTPVEDLNLRKDPIPLVLLRARAAPYENPGFDSCSDIRQQIGDLDAVLGNDYDSAPPGERNLDAAKIAQRVLASLIPYRGVIRELSGAARHEWEFRESISAGLMRRAYLKGLGEAQDCDYPARPMPAAMLAALTNPTETPAIERTAGEPVFVSQPVVQQIN